jgi:hypothetical protein
MTGGARLALGIGGALVAVNVVAAFLGQLSGGEPGGPPGSSYATRDAGVAAYAELLRKAGHDVRALRSPPAESVPSSDETLVVVVGVGVTAAAARALRRFVESGGRLVVAGDPGRWLADVVSTAPSWSPDGSRSAVTIVPVPETAGVTRVVGSGVGRYERLGPALPVVAGARGPAVVVAPVGDGRLVLTADSSTLTNAHLGSEDNAALGLGLAGPASRPVAFAESYHGAAGASGLAAIPDQWRAAFAIFALALVAFMVVRGRRFGPPEPDERELAPPRSAYVDALGALLARGRDRAAAGAALRSRTAERSGTSADTAVVATDGELVAAGRDLAEAERSLRRGGIDEASP